MARKSLDDLYRKRDEMNARIRQEQAKKRSMDRKADTRRKVLAGAVVLEHAERDAAFKTELQTLLGRFLVRDDDRALFGFSPLPAKLAS